MLKRCAFGARGVALLKTSWGIVTSEQSSGPENRLSLKSIQAVYRRRRARLPSIRGNRCKRKGLLRRGENVIEDCMRKNKSIDMLLRELPLTELDAARLIVECVEEMPELRVIAFQGREGLVREVRRVIREGIVAVRNQERTVSFAEAAWKSYERRSERRPTTRRDLRSYIGRLLRFSELADRPLRGISTMECRGALEEVFGNSAHSFRKGRAVLHSIFAFGIQQGWCNQNPVSTIETPRVCEKEILPLTLRECRRLVQTAKRPAFRDCLPALGLMLFAGVRPGEVARLRWEDISWEEDMLLLAPCHSKTGGGRQVALCPSLQRMLRRQWRLISSRSGKRTLLCPPQWEKRWSALRREAGFRRWVPDVLRHTFASYHAKTYHDLPSLQLQLGHRDSSLLRTRYINLRGVRGKDTLPFWTLLG